MTPQQIEDLQPGRETDAAIEAQFFHYGVGLLEDGWIIWEADDKPPRKPRKFSTDPAEALKIFDAAPGWRAWHDDGKINVQLIFRIRDGLTLIQGIGRDESFPLAVCKAALMLMCVLRDFKEKEKAKS
jgi:hypothetical protein